jgi:CubicO group peptidase (beta-lactamase class C family)
LVYTLDQRTVLAMNDVVDFAQRTYPGGVVAVSDDGARTVQPFGTVLTEHGRRAATGDDRFLLTSITKLLVAIQMHLLAADGRLSLDDPISRHVPEFAHHGKEEVTIAHVLTHTTGIDPAANTAESADAAATPEPHVTAAMDAGLISAPGERVAYSSPGYWALAEVTARRSGMSHDAYLLQAICCPLGMADTRFEIGVAAPERYALRDARGQLTRHEAGRRVGYPAGGAVSTAGDLLILGEALAGRLAQVTAGIRARSVDGEWQGVPVRWGVGCELGGPASRWPAGTLFSSGASGTAMWVDPEGRRTVVLLTASWEADRARLAAVGDRAVPGGPHDGV